MKVLISEPYRYMHTWRVRFSHGQFCATRTWRTDRAENIVTHAREFADGVRRYHRGVSP